MGRPKRTFPLGKCRLRSSRKPDKNQWAGIACRIADCFASPDMREEVIAIATALMGGDYVLPSSGGGGNESDLRWDGRRPEEEDYIFKRRCIWHAVNLTMEKYKPKQTKGRSK